jgi:hypothetical protein
MRTEEIQSIQRAVGAHPDGFWGPKSIAATQRHLRSLMPVPHPWPKPSDAAMSAFYGAPGKVPVVKVPMPFEMFLYDGKSSITSITIHARLEESLMRILEHLVRRLPTRQARDDAGITQFFGSYVARQMRGSTRWSKHAWAAAIDFDATRNGLHTVWPTRAHMPLVVMEEFAREGWINLGWLIGRDAMHFQATQ